MMALHFAGAEGELFARSDERAIILSKFKTLQAPAYREIDEILILRAL